MGENVGDAMTKPLLDKLGGEEEGTGNGKDTDTVRNVLSGSQDLSPNSLSQTNPSGRTPDTPLSQPLHVVVYFSQKHPSRHQFLSSGRKIIRNIGRGFFVKKIK
jgi:hypothetical protein